MSRIHVAALGMSPILASSFGVWARALRRFSLPGTSAIEAATKITTRAAPGTATEGITR